MSQAWTPFKDLYQATDGLVSQNRADAYLSTKSLLHLYKSEFLSLLKNAPKNPEDRRKVNECEKNGICVGGDSIPTTFDEGFIADSLVLSDFLDLNERCSLELLLAAEQQKSNYLRYGRCLVSILMYWDGRRNLISSLRNLILCRKESTWSFDLPEDCAHLATSFTDEVKQNGMVARVLQLLKQIKVKEELEKIDHSPHLKGVSSRYLKEVQTLIEEVRVGLSECLLYFSLTKAALTFDEIAAIVEYLKDDGDSGVLSPTTMALLFAVLHSISLPRDEYENNIISMIATPTTVTTGQGNHHLVEDHTILPRIHNLLTVRFANSTEWKTSGILSVLQFFWSLTIARVLTLNISSTPIEWNCMIEQEEIVLDASLAGNVFNFLRNKVVASDRFHSTEFYIRPVHGAITDLIRLMPLKTKSIRNRGDEEARHLQQMQETEMANVHHHYHITTLPPQNNHFKYLMELIGAIYIKDRLNLSLEYLMNDNTTSSRPRHKHALLYKFVRSCGEQLPALLYASYIRMLCGIATGQKSSQKVFEMLRLNSPSSNVEEKGLVSWDTFFRSCCLYYEELREKPLNNSHMGMMMSQINPATGGAVRLIKPHEVDALRAFMKLIATICKHDDICCKLFYENSNWCACDVMFGLLQCPIPVHLKAGILAALANIASSYDDVRAGLLQMAHNCQLLTSNYNSKQSGLIAELEEIETKDEEFPMTRNFLKFLLNVCASFNNAEGMMEYMNYVIEVVFTKIPTRRYSRPEEQWQVAGKCLKIFIKILENHSSVSGDEVTITPASRELLTHIYSQGHFFNMIMKIIKCCLEYLNSYQKDERVEKYMVKSGELSLELILLALQLRDPFFDAVRSSKQNILLMKQNILNGGLDKLLLGVNSATGKSDYIVDIMSFVIYNAWHPQLSLKAVKIMNHLCFSSAVNQRHLMMSLLTSCDKDTREKIFQGFVEILDLACDDRFDENMTEEKICQEFVVRLIIHCSHQPHPNLALLLLGFGKNPAQANLQDPGVFGSARTCLHSIVGILTCNLQPGSCVDPLLAQLCYNLVYKLCANPHTSASTLRYLRSSYDFFTKHLQCLPFSINDPSKSNEVILQQSYLMKSAAIEIYSLINNQQRGNAERIMQLLFNASGGEFGPANMTTTGISMTTHINNTGAGDFSTTMFDTTSNTMLESQQEDLKFLQILNSLDLQQMYPSPLRLEQFISSVVEEEIKKCENINNEGLAYCDVKTLHASLEGSLAALNGTDDANRKILAQNDVQNILRCVVERNGIRETIFAKLSYLNAWKEIFEISISTNDLMPKEKYEQMLLSVATSIIGKARDSDSELMSVFATSMLAIFTSIRDIMNETVDSTTGRMVKKMKELKPSFAASLKIIIQGIMEWVTQTDTREGVRVYLYSTLLSYLQLCTRPKHRSLGDDSEKTIVNLSKEDIYSKMARENSKLFKTFGDSLISLLCKDACTGHIVCRTLALACMDSIIQIDSNFVWISYITKNGYLNNIAQSFAEEDSSLCLDLNSSISQALYVYEQKMALLCSMAQSPDGARELLDCGILQIFAGCKFFDSRLNIEEDGKKLSVYRQLVFPILRLCSSIFTSLGGRQHHGASTSVFNFLLSHADTLINPLFDNHVTYTNIEHLTEWKLVTGLLCQLPDVKEIQQHNQVFAALQRIQRQIVSSVSRIFLTEKELFQLRDDLAGNKPTFDKICILLNEIGANLLAFLRIFSITSSNSDVSNLYFSPNLNNVGAFTDNQKANVGILIRILQTAVKNYQEVKRVKKSRQVLYFIIENCLLLLWRHVEYFVLKCAAGGRKTKSILFPDENFGAMTSSNRQFSSSVNQGHDVDIEKFKSGLRSALSLNGLLKQLTSFDGRNHLSIIPSITRHVQRIINLHTSPHPTF